jgi:hypothetical protein
MPGPASANAELTTGPRFTTAVQGPNFSPSRSPLRPEWFAPRVRRESREFLLTADTGPPAGSFALFIASSSLRRLDAAGPSRQNHGRESAHERAYAGSDRASAGLERRRHRCARPADVPALQGSPPSGGWSIASRATRPDAPADGARSRGVPSACRSTTRALAEPVTVSRWRCSGFYLHGYREGGCSQPHPRHGWIGLDGKGNGAPGGTFTSSFSIRQSP